MKRDEIYSFSNNKTYALKICLSVFMLDVNIFIVHKDHAKNSYEDNAMHSQFFTSNFYLYHLNNLLCAYFSKMSL